MAEQGRVLAAAAGAFPCVAAALGLALLPILAVGGLAFVVDSADLRIVLAASLVLPTR
jgi:hypothetical protein